MANLSKIRREQMLDFLEQLKKHHSDDQSICAFNQIENELREKKYGLVWEEHSEEVDDLLKENIPILTEDSDKRICKSNNLPWNFIIEGDNLQALYLLSKTHKGAVDCIYIDPPYNTGAKDWKYNNNYVDGNDLYRHSKWLSMMAQRLKVAKQILNPETGVLICTIDEHEIHHLRSLLEELFPEAFIQMATIVINQKGVSQGRLARVEEYAIYVFMKNAFVPTYSDDLLSQKELATSVSSPRWERLLRGGNNSRREDSPTMFYPVYVDPINKKVIDCGSVLPIDQDPDLSNLDDKTVAWPIRTDGSFGNYQLQPSTFKELLNKGFIKLGTWDKKRKTWTILYLNKGTRKRIDEGEIIITGRDEITGTVSIEFARPEAKMYNIKTVWYRKLHDSGVYGSTLLSSIIGRDIKFDFPKSLYSTKDTLENVLRNNMNATVVDFFAGSGTTLNAINLMNAEDNGKRTCILVTNNECSEDDAKQLTKLGYSKGDDEWEALGICKAVTWPRTRNTILGIHEDGTPLEGEYYTDLHSSVEKKRSFTQIAFAPEYASLSVNEKRQILFLTAHKTMPKNLVQSDSKYIVSPNEKHNISILFDDMAVEEWLDALDGMEHITDFYVLTKNNKKFRYIKQAIQDLLGNYTVQDVLKRPFREGFEANVKYFKCDWTPRKPEDYLLSNALCFHIKEMIELQNSIEIDNVKNILILNKEDYKKTLLNPDIVKQIENIWVNQNIIFTAEEMDTLNQKGFKYIPKEFFGQELREVAE